MLWLLTGCATSSGDPMLIRGQLDPERAIVHVCDSESSYPYAMTSVAASQYLQLLDQLDPEPHEPLIAEFYAAILARPSRGSPFLSVGKVLRLQRGVCRHAA